MIAKSYRVWDINDRLLRNGWRLASLGKLLEKSNEKVEIEPTQTYKEITVRLWGRGVVLRGKKSGSEIGNTKRFRVHGGQFIFSRIDARNGAFGIIPDELEGAVVSTDFPVYNAKMDLLFSDYLGWLSRVPSFIDACRAVSEGTTNRVRLKEDKFYGIEIPLPPLSEQHRIVAKIERLAAKVEESKSLRLQADAIAGTFNSVCYSAIIDYTKKCEELGSLIRPDTTISYGVLVPGPDTPGGIPFVRVQDLKVHQPKEKPNKSISPEIDARYARTRLEGGEVLLGVVGSIGKVGIAPASWRGSNIARAVCRIVPGANLDSIYLVAVLQTREAQRYFTDATRTLAQPTLNVSLVKKTLIPAAWGRATVRY